MPGRLLRGQANVCLRKPSGRGLRAAAIPGSILGEMNTDHGKANLQDAGSLPQIAAVGSFKEDVSPLGVMDLAGNVFEWVEDRYALYPGNRTFG